MKKFASTLLIGASLAAGISTFSAFADEDNPYIVHRQAIYKIAAGHMQAMKSILFLDHPAKGDINFHATSLLDAFKHHGNAFPEGSDEGDTAAKKTIWENPEDFKAAGQNAGKAISKLISVSANADADPKQLAGAFKEVGKSCKGCHKEFRKDD